jgi:hypothetical protein
LERRDRSRRWRALLDYRLADQDNGILLAERIKQLRGDEVAIFLMTAETDEQILAEANAKNLRVLRKPLKPINLRAALMCSKRWHIFLAAGEHWVGVDSNRFHLNQRPTANGRGRAIVTSSRPNIEKCSQAIVRSKVEKTPPRSGLAVFLFRWTAYRLGEVWRRRWRSSSLSRRLCANPVNV